MMRELRRLLAGERRRVPRYNAEKVHVTNRIADVELRLARHLRMAPEDLYDYRRADSILGGLDHDRH